MRKSIHTLLARLHLKGNAAQRRTARRVAIRSLKAKQELTEISTGALRIDAMP